MKRTNAITLDDMEYHPDVLAAHTQFGGDLPSMQALYDWPIHKRMIRELQEQLIEAQRVHRWSVDNTGDGILYVCRNNHDKGDPCKWEAFVPLKTTNRSLEGETKHETNSTG